MEHSSPSQLTRKERIRAARECCEQQYIGGSQRIRPLKKETAKTEEKKLGIRKGTLARYFLSSLLFLAFYLAWYFNIPSDMVDIVKIQDFLKQDFIVEQLEQNAANYLEETILPVFRIQDE